MRIEIPYGRSVQHADLPAEIQVDVIEAQEAPPLATPAAAVGAALDQLVGDADWARFSRARSVAIAINDKTRPVPHEHLLPPLLARLAQLGIADSAITFFIAVGTHPPMTADEFPAILPEAIVQRYRVVSHDAEDTSQFVRLGDTPRGTPVWANRAFATAELKIVVGNIEPHQFVGFSGGVKTAAIGLAGMVTITRNHAWMTHPDSRLGDYETNPARQDVEDIGRAIGIHLALNAVLNRKRQLVRVLAGEPHAVMLAGVPLSRQTCQAPVSGRYGLMITSPGGHPKDINLYQSQKALAHATLVARSGGTIILTAACSEGTGSPPYEEWMADKRSHEDVIARFRAEGFHIGPHKAFQIARDATFARLLFCSEMDSRLMNTLLLNPARNLQHALDLALPGLRPGERIGILPHASSTIPYVAGPVPVQANQRNTS